jgi:hypothetical protein
VVRRAVLATLTLLLAAPALADPPWSPPRDASPSAAFLTTPGIAFGRDGAALLSWNTGEPPRARLATLQADGAIVQRGGLAGSVAAKPLVTRGDRTAILTRRRRITKDFRTLDRLDVTFGTTSTPHGRSRRVAAYRAAGEEQGPAMAAARGEVAVAWVELRRPRDPLGPSYRIRVAVSRGGRAFGRPLTLATTRLPTRDSQSVALAYGRGRELLAAYSTARRADGRRPVIAVRTRRPGHGFSRAQVLGTRQPLCDLAAAAAPNGRAFVAWGSQDSGEEASRPWVVRAALRGAGARRFGRSAVLDPGETRDRVRGHLAAVVARGGAVTLAWTNVRGATFPLRTASAPAHGPFAAATEVVPDGVVGGLAVSAAGSTVLSWSDSRHEELESPPPRDVFAALRPAGATAFGPPERVSTPELDDSDPAVPAFDPRSGRPTLGWPAGPDPGSARMRISTRAG